MLLAAFLGNKDLSSLSKKSKISKLTLGIMGGRVGVDGEVELCDHTGTVCT